MRLEQETRWLLRDKYGGQRSAEFVADVGRLEAGEPVDYVIGWKEFLGCKIDLSERPLIPREETEYWVGKVVGEIANWSKPLRVLDVFAGSGCIGLAVLKHVPNAYVTFVDSEKNCIKQIKKNLRLNGIDPERYKVIQSDLFSALRQLHNALSVTCYDLILANPPYVAIADDRIQPSVRGYEPHTALYAGTNGLAVIQPFLQQAPKYLQGPPRVFMEHDPKQKAAIEGILRAFGYKNWQFHHDQFNRWRWVEITCAVVDANKWS